MLKLIADAASAAEYARCRHVMQQASRHIAEFFTRYDLLLTPTAALPPVPIGTFSLRSEEALQMALVTRLRSRRLLLLALDKMAKRALAATPNTMLWNMTGQPAMSVPLYWSAAGLPIGAQFVGRFGDEATLFRLAAQLEEARPWARRLPPSIV
jgi:amidase